MQVATSTSNGTLRKEPSFPPQAQTNSMWITVATDYAALEKHKDAWWDLTAHALEPNAYYDPWILLPALQIIGAGKDLLFLLIYRSDPQQSNKPVLCGFFPLERARSYKGLPISCISLWAYDNCFLSTPLIRKTDAKECVSAFFDWLENDPQSRPLMEFRQIAGEGPVYQRLVDEFRMRCSLTFHDHSFTRAFLRRRQDADAYLGAAMSANKRRDLQRKERRLREQGRLELVRLDRQGDFEFWLEAFLRLEASGWKGREGTALACKETDLPFFKAVARQGFENDQLLMAGLFLNDQPIAIRCSFLSRPGSFFYKPAYDEAYGRFSPGVLLEVETIRQVHSDPALEWMDSCTSPENTLLNNLWLDRRIIQTVLMATGKGVGRLVISILPLIRWFNRKLGRYQPPVIVDH